MTQIHDYHFQMWCKKQNANKIFQWGGLSTVPGEIAIHKEKKFNDMTEDEKRFQFKVFCHCVIEKEIKLL